MKQGVVQFIFFISLFYKSFQFIIIDEELGNFYEKNENYSKIEINESDYDLSKLFKVYDEVFNLTEQLDSNVTLKYNNNVSVMGIDVVNIKDNDARDLINIDDIKAESDTTDTFLMETVEGNVEIETKFMIGAQTVPNLFIEEESLDENANIDSRMNETEDFVDYNATYEGMMFLQTIKNITPTTLMFDSDIPNPAFAKVQSQSEENLALIENTNNSKLDQNGFGRKMQFDNNTMFPEESTVSNELWNITDQNLTFVMAHERSTTKISFKDKVFTTKDRDNIFDADNIKQNFSINNAIKETMSTKLARDITEVAVKNALSREKPKFPDIIIAKKKSINMVSVLMILLSLLALCLLLGVFIILSLQKFNCLRHNDTTPA